MYIHATFSTPFKKQEGGSRHYPRRIHTTLSSNHYPSTSTPHTSPHSDNRKKTAHPPKQLNPREASAHRSLKQSPKHIHISYSIPSTLQQTMPNRIMPRDSSTCHSLKPSIRHKINCLKPWRGHCLGPWDSWERPEHTSWTMRHVLD